jgi:hypothetical protein
MSSLIPHIDVIRLDFVRALRQLETRFDTIDIMTKDDIEMMNAFVGITQDEHDVLYVTPFMRAEDHLEHLLADIIKRPRILPSHKRGRLYTVEQDRAEMKECQARETAAYADELIEEGVHTQTAHDLAKHLVHSRDSLVQFLKTLHTVNDIQPDI